MTTDARLEPAPPRFRLRKLRDRIFLYTRECPVCDQNIIDDNIRCTCFAYEMPNAGEILDVIDAVIAEQLDSQALAEECVDVMDETTRIIMSSACRNATVTAIRAVLEAKL